VGAKLKDVVGVVDDLILVERETFDILITDLKDQFTI